MADKNMKAKINVEFTEATSRQSIESGDSINTLFGKIKKFFSDLKSVAFSGSYNDLSNKPTIPTELKNPCSLIIQGNGTTLTNGTYDGSAAKTVNITPSSIGAAATSHTHSYLPLSGGTLTTSGYYGLVIKRSDTNGSAISYRNSNGILGGAGFLKDGTYQVETETNGYIFKATTTEANFPRTVIANEYNATNNINFGYDSTDQYLQYGGKLTRYSHGGEFILYNISASGTDSTAGNRRIVLDLYTDTGGGNIRIFSSQDQIYYKDTSGTTANHWWEIDTPNRDLRFYNYYGGDSTTASTYKAITFGSDGSVTASSFKGNATSATKLATARTISTTGDVVSSGTFDGSGNLSLSTIRRGCVVGQSGSTTTNPYYKFASISVNTAYIDRNITFKVSIGYRDASTSLGILTAHFRTDSNGYWESGQLNWEYANSGIDTSKFILAHNSSTNPAVVELWVKCDVAYGLYHFDVISEGSRTERLNNLWTLYDTSSVGSASTITSGYTQLTSSLNTIKNSISGNANSSTYTNITTMDSGENTYYPVWSSNTSGSQLIMANNGIRYRTLEGTTETDGYGALWLGNGAESKTAGNKYGRLRLYSKSTGFTDLVSTTSSSNYTITLPAKSGVVSLDGHTHNYLPLSGGTVAGNLTVNGTFKANNIITGTKSLTISSASALASISLTSTDLGFTPSVNTSIVATVRKECAPTTLYLNTYTTFYNSTLYVCITNGSSTSTTVPTGTYHIDYIITNNT